MLCIFGIATSVWNVRELRRRYCYVRNRAFCTYGATFGTADARENATVTSYFAAGFYQG
jgi:hypothetical protein